MQLLFNALIAGSLAALIAGGLALVYGVLGVFNLALGQMVLLGGYFTWWFHTVAGLSLLLSIPLGLLCGGIVAWITFEAVIHPFYRFHQFLPLVTTIAWSMLLDGLILLSFEERPLNILQGSQNFVEFMGSRISVEQMALIVVTLIFLSVIAWVLHATAFGRKIRASVSHADAARSLGISSAILHRALFIGSGILAAAAGIFVGIDQNLTPTLAFPLTIKAYAAVIAGGKGHFWGTIICAYAIALLEQLAIGIPWFGGSYIPAGYQAAVALILIIGFLLWKPNGIFGSSARTA